MDELLQKAGVREGDKIPGQTEGMTFPASKDELVREARRQHLPPDVIKKLEDLPDKRYENISELVKAAGGRE